MSSICSKPKQSLCACTVKALLEFIPRIDADQQILSDFLIYLGKNANLHNM